MSTADTVTFLLSIIAIIISIGVAITESKRELRMNRLNIEAEYFSQIYKDFLIEKIPKARRRLHFELNKLIGIEQLIDVIKEMRERSLYFYYRDFNFYEGLQKRLQTTEDYLMEKVNEGIITDNRQEIFFKQVNTYIESIYGWIAEAHFGE